jgi:hypothetical protein
MCVCVCMYGFCNLCGCFDNMCTFICCVLYCLYRFVASFMYSYSYLFLLPPNENTVALSKYVITVIIIIIIIITE